MSISSLLNQPCTLLRAGTGPADVFGDATLTMTEEETVCALQRLRPQQLRGGEEEDLSYPSSNAFVALPGTLDPPGSNDALVIAGTRWEFMETPEPVVHPVTLQTSHYEVLARNAG